MTEFNNSIIKKLSEIFFPDGHYNIEIIFHDKEIKNISITNIIRESIELNLKKFDSLNDSDKESCFSNIIDEIAVFPDYGSIGIDINIDKGNIQKYKIEIANRFSVNRFNSLKEEELNNLF